MPKEIQLRDAEMGDYDFIYYLHRESLKIYIDQTWGWDEEWQIDYFRKNFDLSGKKIIHLEGLDIGCLTVKDMGEHIFLAYIALLREHQGQGIGTKLIRGVLGEARAREIPVKLKVLRTNPAHALYEHLGFKIIETSNTHYFMQFDP